MLTTPSEAPAIAPIRPSHVRRLWDNPRRNTAILGCPGCPILGACGGLHLGSGIMDCLQFCCGKPQGCDQVCRNNGDYVDRIREINGFSLCTVPRTPVLSAPILPPFLPILFHGKRRAAWFDADAVALPLYSTFDRRTGTPRFSFRSTFESEFLISGRPLILLTGTDEDAPLERWWGIGEAARRTIIRSLVQAGVTMATTPNYSLIINRPRTDDLHSIKRIGLVFAEFLDEGLPAALHVNGRTDTDFLHWAEFIAERPEVTHLAYEFRTMSGRQETHVDWLIGLTQMVGRPLHLLVRGGTEYLAALKAVFAGISFMDTSVFMKTMKRQRACRREDGTLGWKSNPTDQGAPLDDLLIENTHARARWVSELMARPTQ